MFDLQEMTIEDAKPLIGQTFEIRFSDGNIVKLTLERVDSLMEKHISPHNKREAFSMLFRGPREVILRQHIYALYNEQSEQPLELFLVPLGMEPAGGLYEAIFN